MDAPESLRIKLNPLRELGFDFKNFDYLNHNINFLELENKYVTLVFGFDLGPLEVTFYKNKEPKTVFSVYAVYSYLYKNSNEFKNFPKLDWNKDSTQILLNYYLDLILIDLVNVFRGDFSWTKDFTNEQEKIQKAYGIIYSGKIDHSDPIYLKYKTKDTSWITDIIKKFNL